MNLSVNILDSRKEGESLNLKIISHKLSRVQRPTVVGIYNKVDFGATRKQPFEVTSLPSLRK